MKKRYFIKVYLEDDLDNSIDSGGIQLPIHPNLAHDVLLIIEGEKNTDNFLQSPNHHNKTIYKVLKDISIINSKLRAQKNVNFKKVGLNIYFPDFTFKEKRAMAQFVKSVSLVIDSIKNPDLRNIPLYFTFDKNAKKVSNAFLVDLSEMVDSVFVVNTQSFSDFEAVSVDDDVSKIEKLKNQFYFAKYYTTTFPSNMDSVTLENINLLMKADYQNPWEGYLLGIIVIILVLLIGTICYYSMSFVAEFIHNNHMYIFAGIIFLIAEIILLFVFMFEEMNDHTKVFNLWEILIVLTMLVFFIPLIKNGIKGKNTP